MLMKPFVSGLALSFMMLWPLSMKWELDKKVTVPAAALIGAMSGALVHHSAVLRALDFYQIIVAQVFIIGILSVSLLLWRFYRDPDREPPISDNIILSPADGRIIYVKKIDDGKIPFSEKNGRKFPLEDFVQSKDFTSGGHLVGIAMNYLDVHVNRAPISGRVGLIKHIKGLFISLKHKEAIIQNERVLTVIDNTRFKVGIVQIASRLVRKITPYLKHGDEVSAGQRIGAIRFGSQVDVVLPELPSLTIVVGPGERVKAGLSVIASFQEKEPCHEIQ